MSRPCDSLPQYKQDYKIEITKVFLGNIQLSWRISVYVGVPWGSLLVGAG